MIARASTLIVCDQFTSGAKLLVLKRDGKARLFPNTLDLIGGVARAHERPIDSAVRELAEETGLIVQRQYIRYLFTKRGPGFLDHIFLYSCRIQLSTLHIGEGSDLLLLPLHQLLTTRMAFDHQRTLAYTFRTRRPLR